MASGQRKPIRSLLSTQFRLVFGDDDRVVFWLIALGGISSSGTFLLIMGLMFHLADTPPSSTTEVVSGVLSELFQSPGFWFLLIGIGGLMVRRRWAILQMRQLTPTTRESNQGLFGVLFGNDYRVALWIMVMGSVWAGNFALYVAPSFLESGKPPGYAWIGPPDDLPPVEHIVQDALIPMASYVMTHSLGAWIMTAGAAIALVQWGRRSVRPN